MTDTATTTMTTTGSTDSAKMMQGDSTFLAKASETGVFEIEAGKLAQKNSQNADVKGFASMMITAHTAMGKDVSAQAQKENITLPVGMGDDNKKEWDKLNGLKGPQFDKEYASVNVKGHIDAIDLFDKTSTDKNCSSAVQQLAAAGLPKLKTHKEHADILKDKVSKM
jgi:putative membrane protein